MRPAQAVFLLATALGGLAAARAPAQPGAAVPAVHVASTRVRLDCLLREHELRRADILAEQARVRHHLATVETFRAGLDPVQNAASIVRADQAISRDRNALAAIAERLALTDAAIAQTRRAIAGLRVPPETKSLAQRLREAASPRLAAAMHCGLPASASSVGDTPLVVRLLAADLCGERTDAFFTGRAGVSADPVARARLDRILARLDAAGGAVPVVLLPRCPREGGGAFSTSTTAFIGECIVGPDRTDDEIAFVVAHERAHVRLQHLSVTYVATAWDRYINGPKPEGVNVDTADRFIVATSLAARLGDFDRDQEYEADLVGAADMMSAGYSVDGIAQFLRGSEAHAAAEERARLASLSAAERARDRADTARRAAVRMSDDHPGPAERKKALEAAFGEGIWASGGSGSCR